MLWEKKMVPTTLVYFQSLNIFEGNVELSFHAIYHKEFKFCFSFMFISESYLEDIF